MSTPGLGAALVDAAKGAAGAIKGGAVDLMDNVASAEHVFNKYPEAASFAQRYRTEFSQPVHAKASLEIQRQLNLREQVKVKHEGELAQGKVHTKQELADYHEARKQIDTGRIYAEAANNGEMVKGPNGQMIKKPSPREQFGGPNDIAAVQTAVILHDKHGLASAQLFSDAYAYLMRDRVPIGVDPHPVTGAKEPLAYVSTFKNRVYNAGVPVKREPTYTPRNKIEKATQAWANTTMVPLLAIPHITTFFNSTLGTSPGNWVGGVIKSIVNGVGRRNDMWQPLLESGVLTETIMREADFYNKFHASDRTFKLPENSIYGNLYKMFHQPGFAPMRDFMLIQGGTIGKITADQVAQDFVKNPKNESLLWQVKEFGLDPKKLISQNGQLDHEDMLKAIYAFVDKYYFVDNALQKSRLLSASPTGRTLGTFHGYVTRQRKLMYRAMFKDMKERGPASVARNLAIGGLAFPMFGEGVKIVGLGIRGQPAKKEAEKDIENIEFEHGVGPALESYIEAMSHVGAVGVYAHMMRGALHHGLLDAAAGPIIGAQAEFLQDTVSGLNQVYKHGGRRAGHYLAPVGRDLAYDVPYVSLGTQLLGHRLFHRKGERSADDPVKQLYDNITGGQQ